ncbi:hypothetical protein NEOLEDRAFT_1139901 [Neolentinus lepideus HHB14362 ss-1]|uniref:Protein kinase domain-containing protein n=1 Tax=Neolentinus lepideus HHB14362 ss-1 TaxID=1314782 RepID=A0A165PHR8_9AGAM|nr:hypothetical protein NEOLEDRAFT_1139901 [Neolentinus lepideus HHB14362 ss-1]
MDYAERLQVEPALDEAHRIRHVLVGSRNRQRDPLVSLTGFVDQLSIYAHADSYIKPQNFVLASSARLQLIDFGTAAPLLLSRADGSRRVPRCYCLFPCDYISPEILAAHEQALVTLDTDGKGEGDGYGRETDW